MPPKKGAGKPAAHIKTDSGKFYLPNGDRYCGEYQANSKTKTVVRQGKIMPKKLRNV